MGWMELIGDAIQYIEDHLTEELSVKEISEQVGVSPFYFQKGFSMLCGFTIGEYIRNRRLALAANELAAGQSKVIDVALKYGYDSPDSFARAFTRFHGVTPSQARKQAVTLRSFAPLKIRFSLEGGHLMDYRIEKKDAFSVLGRSRVFPYEGAKEQVPAFWQEHYQNGGGKVVCGMFGVNFDEDMLGESFEYLIADLCAPDAQPPEGFVVRTVPTFTWAIFPCKGPMPVAMQDVNVKIFSEWLPSIGNYRFAAGYCVEFYDDPRKYPKGTLDENYYSEIWIPVCPK